MSDSPTGLWWQDDDTLLVALERALNPDDAVPENVIRTAIASYSWHHIDAELAALSYDSAADDAESARTRTESAVLRALTFEANDLTLELEVRPDSLAGQLVGAEVSELVLQLDDGQTVGVSISEHGYFRITPAPATPFRLRCRLSDNRIVATVLIRL